MVLGSLRPSGQKSMAARIIWGFALLLSLFLAENIWVDPWLRHKSYPVPSFVPVAFSIIWFLALMIVGIALTLLFVSEVTLIRDRTGSIWTKLGTAIATLVVLLLGIQWLYVTNGKPGILRLHASGQPHKVLLNWKASSSRIAGYNVYRSTTHGAQYVRINGSLLHELTYTDDTVVSGETYYYVARSADSLGNESANSPEFTITIP